MSSLSHFQSDFSILWGCHFFDYLNRWYKIQMMPSPIFRSIHFLHLKLLIFSPYQRKDMHNKYTLCNNYTLQIASSLITSHLTSYFSLSVFVRRALTVPDFSLKIAIIVLTKWSIHKWSGFMCEGGFLFFWDHVVNIEQLF